MTLTFADRVTDIREAQRRFNSLRGHVLAERYAASIAVVERMKSGRIHFHLLVVLADDVRTGFEFDQVERRNYSSANKAIRSEWAFWRATAPKYGFGRTELMPVRSTTEGIARYVGKYIAKHIDARVKEDKGARLVRYTANARQVGTRFAWVGVRPWLFRKKVALAAAELGVSSTEEMRMEFGPRWAYHLAGYIMSQRIPRDAYPSFEHELAEMSWRAQAGYFEE